jgi:hypothetical protein
MKAYHFVGPTLRDGRPVPPDGEWLVHEGPVKLCESGLHFSRHPFDALLWAPGATLCLVEVEDIVEEMADTGVCRRRQIVRRIDATELLRGFIRWCALQVIHLWDAPDVVRRYLETGDESLRAAARYATMGADKDTSSASWAAWYATWNADWNAPYVVWNARYAARDAAKAARVAQRAEFARLVDEAFNER